MNSLRLTCPDLSESEALKYVDAKRFTKFGFILLLIRAAVMSITSSKLSVPELS